MLSFNGKLTTCERDGPAGGIGWTEVGVLFICCGNSTRASRKIGAPLPL